MVPWGVSGRNPVLGLHLAVAHHGWGNRLDTPQAPGLSLQAGQICFTINFRRW